MSQLFTLQFPKYHFDQQREFTVTLPVPLPFTYEITNGMVCGEQIKPPAPSEQLDAQPMKKRKEWARAGLQEGVRLIRITNKDITDEGSLKPSDVDPDKIAEIVHEHTTHDKRIAMTFREEVYLSAPRLSASKLMFLIQILTVDDSVSLGLRWTAQSADGGNDDDDDHKIMSKQDKFFGLCLCFCANQHPNSFMYGLREQATR